MHYIPKTPFQNVVTEKVSWIHSAGNALLSECSETYLQVFLKLTLVDFLH